MSLSNVGIVGASGAVGLELIKLLEERNFPVRTLRCFGSKRSAGSKIPFNESSVIVEELSPTKLEGLDLVFFSAGSKISKEYAPIAQKLGIVVIDNSSAFRLDKEVPLVIPEVNPEALKTHKGIIANPNCATILMLMALAPLHKIAKLKRIVVSTYQAASGAGLKAMEELEEETLAYLENRPYTRSVIPHPYAFNLFLHNSAVKDNGYLEEELKLVHETHKILGDNTIRIGATCVRVPVLRSHSESINAEFHQPISEEEATEVLKHAEGVIVTTSAMPVHATGQNSIFCGRIRKDLSQDNTLDLWVVGDQILKGAALNAIQIAEKILIQDDPIKTLTALQKQAFV